MKKLLCLLALVITCSASNAQDQDKAALLSGLTLSDFVNGFNLNAKGDGEPQIDGRACEQRPIPNTKKKSFSCRVGAFSFVHGVIQDGGALQHVSIDGKPETGDDMHGYRRAAGYMVRSAKGGSILGVGTVVADLLGAAAKAKGKIQERRQYGLSLSAGRDEFGWSFGAEPAKKAGG